MTSDEFRQRMAELPEPVTDKQPPYWEFWRHQLWHLGQTDDPANFTNWPCVYHTMLVNHWPDAIQYEMSNLKVGYLTYTLGDGIINNGPLSIPHFGPRDYFIHKEGFKTNVSMNLIHQTYHIQQWEEATGRNISTLDTIVEFGGGYGAMALLCHRLGFKGRYVIYDLPEFSLLQEWYLSQYGITAEWPKENLLYGRPDLLIALYSISEAPIQTRYDFFSRVRSNSSLFLYSGQWEDWDNVDYFQRELNYLNENWKHTELMHLPDRNNWYSIGW